MSRRVSAVPVRAVHVMKKKCLSVRVSTHYVSVTYLRLCLQWMRRSNPRTQNQIPSPFQGLYCSKNDNNDVKCNNNINSNNKINSNNNVDSNTVV